LSLIALTDEHGYLLSPNLEYLYHKDRPTTHIKTRRNHGVLTIQGAILPPRKTPMPQALAAISPSQAHSRLGHISQKRIKQAEQHVEGLKVDWVVPNETTPCISCGQGALARKKISKGPRQRPLATQPRTACTVDFLGPRKTSLAGHSYALIFSDLYTGICQPYLLRDKSGTSALAALRQWRAEWLGPNPHEGIQIYVDRDSALVHGPVAAQLREWNWVTRTASPHEHATHPCEGVISALTKMTHSMMHDMPDGKRLWDRTLATAAYIRNRLPPAKDGPSPHEKAGHGKPDVTTHSAPTTFWRSMDRDARSDRAL